MRVLGITIPEKKQLHVGLTELYGVGATTARKVLTEAGVSLSAKPADLSIDQENAIRRALEAMTIEGNLKREISANIKRLKDVKAYRGVRHSKRLPVRGQRSKTNSRTIRGNVRNTMGSGRRKESKT
ncbi:MAG TPA: 30S ribosomal protein S13 [Candidatus Paceibacterota bacterium]|nr:30S ribosomal protein S13 [Candidatus Paceibacterota bacterium]